MKMSPRRLNPRLTERPPIDYIEETERKAMYDCGNREVLEKYDLVKLFTYFGELLKEKTISEEELRILIDIISVLRIRLRKDLVEAKGRIVLSEDEINGLKILNSLLENFYYDFDLNIDNPDFLGAVSAIYNQMAAISRILNLDLVKERFLGYDSERFLSEIEEVSNFFTQENILKLLIIKKQEIEERKAQRGILSRGVRATIKDDKTSELVNCVSILRGILDHFDFYKGIFLTIKNKYKNALSEKPKKRFPLFYSAKSLLMACDAVKSGFPLLDEIKEDKERFLYDFSGADQRPYKRIHIEGSEVLFGLISFFYREYKKYDSNDNRASSNN